MKINGKIISSLHGLSLNFNFYEIWQKLSVFKRDINPDNLYFTEEQKRLFQLFEFADKATISDDSINLGDFCLSLKEDQKRVTKMNNISKSDRIIVISLFALANKEIAFEQILDLFNPLSDFGDTIILSGGKSINLSSNPKPEGILMTKKIIVPTSSSNNCFVGGLQLKPGEFTFGIFSKNELIKVCPNELENRSYHLKFGLFQDNQPKLIVTSLSTGQIIAEYPGCTYFGTLGNDNFIIINKGKVQCFNDQHLLNIFHKQIGPLDEPQFFDIDSTIITITLKNGNRIKINY